jgi:16S rRNA (guanine527-N7)-methyltransferase
MTLTASNRQADLDRRLEKAALSLGLDLSPHARDTLVEYLLELSKWNRTYNLTALKTLEQMLVQHVFDCLALIPVMDVYEKHARRQFQVVADVGSGAGLPAVVIAACRPATQVISIDAVEKKSAFVLNVSNKLGLVNLVALHGRVEQRKDISADLVVSRAFASIEKFVDLAQAAVAPNGVMAAMKSKMLSEESKELEISGLPWLIDQVDELKVPDLNATRYVAWLKRKQRHD